MAKTLQLVFRNELGKEVVFSLADPREGLTLAEVQTVMQNILTKNIFTSTGGNLLQIADARIQTKEAVSLQA